MTEDRRCCSREGPTDGLQRAARPVVAVIKPTDTVEAVSGRSSLALETMKALRINHCCGAHLSLAEAAASVGVPLETLITRLDEALAAEVGP